VIVGSVFKSWDLLKAGFFRGLIPRDELDVTISRVSVYQLTETPSVGAALLAASRIGKHISVDFTKNARLFFTQAINDSQLSSSSSKDHPPF